MEDIDILKSLLASSGTSNVAEKAPSLSASGIDFADIATIANIVRKPDVDGNGKFDLKDVVLIAMQNPAKIKLLFTLIAGLFHHAPKPGPSMSLETVPHVALPTPTRDTKPISEIDRDTGPESTVHPSRVTPGVPVQRVVNGRAATRTVDSLQAKLFFIEQAGNIVDKERFKEIKRGGNIPWGARIHFDITPYAAGVAIQPGAPELPGMLQEDGETPAMKFRVLWDGAEGSGPDGEMPGPSELHSYDDDFGCTPVVKIPKDAEDEAQHTLVLQAILPACPATGNVEIVSNEVSVNIS